jgi:transcriptional regulator with AAA-type ATPase domain
MNEQNVASMKRYNVSIPMSHREALENILKICSESSDYSRRVQHIAYQSMMALGMTDSQRIDRHNRILQRSEQYKENRSMIGKSRARQELREQQSDEGLGGF